jgi:hypothetical protein
VGVFGDGGIVQNGAVLSDSLPSTGPEGQDVVRPGYLGITPPPEPTPVRGERLWVDRPEQLQHAVDILQQASVVAIDAEFTQVRSHTSSASNRLALLQLAIDQHCFVVDAWRLADLSPLLSVTGDPDISILLFGAGADMQVMAERSLSVAHYIDLEAASRSIFGQHESSLAAMLQRAFNIRLDKSLQRTDWTRRPLPTAMISYAARDAEMTLALYGWLRQHYAWALQLHEYVGQEVRVAGWIEPFLRGTSTMPVEMAVKEAIKQGLLDAEQIEADCRAALASLVHPMQRSRLLRVIGDLALVQLAGKIVPLLQAQAADERAAAVRSLARLQVEKRTELIRPLLQDPVYDVRKAAQTALRTLSDTRPRKQRPVPTRLADGTRSWTVGETSEADNNDDESEWKARLRAIMDE